MFGTGSEALPPFVKNTDLHNYMLKAAGIEELVVAS
jgi:alkaline phosphatase